MAERMGRRRGRVVSLCLHAGRWIFSKRHGPTIFVFKTVAFVLALNALLLFAFGIAGSELHGPERATGRLVVAALLLAPLLENLAFIGLAGLLGRAHLPRRHVIWIVGCVLGATHWPFGPAGMVASSVSFIVMAASWFVWDDRPFARRYGLTVAQHALINLFALANLVVLEGGWP